MDKHCSFVAGDVDSFDFQHRLLNTHFAITFYFNELAAMLTRLVPAYLLLLPGLEAEPSSRAKLGFDLYRS